ncbi:MAG TPA: orotidine-5'-phosphate decarboxylase [Acidimicrobiales bacterium]|nr:orotidine-5'-phosphate decarboxylase [Acidimicrobiales bacterium]
MDARDRLALALDVDDMVAALRLARRFQPWFGVVKVGLELFTAAGPDAVAAMVNAEFSVFLDLKAHDIPTTVRKAARVAGALGASYLTLHAHGGTAMLRAGVDGLREGAQSAGVPVPLAVAVTVLTSDADAPPHILGRRVATAVEGGCGGLVCAADDVREAKELAPRMFTVVPGIRLPQSEPHDQARAATPEQAIAAGADLLVIGRAVTAARDPEAAATALTEALAATA